MYKVSHGKQWPASDVIIWCDKNFPRERWSYYGDRLFEFYSEQDLVLFSLRWS